jgi:hypothetical protein
MEVIKALLQQGAGCLQQHVPMQVIAEHADVC